MQTFLQFQIILKSEMKMVDEKLIISQCIDLADQVIKKGISAASSISIGEGFIFNFDNKDSELNVRS